MGAGLNSALGQGFRELNDIMMHQQTFDANMEFKRATEDRQMMMAEQNIKDQMLRREKLEFEAEQIRDERTSTPVKLDSMLRDLPWLMKKGKDGVIPIEEIAKVQGNTGEFHGVDGEGRLLGADGKPVLMPKWKAKELHSQAMSYAAAYTDQVKVLKDLVPALNQGVDVMTAEISKLEKLKNSNPRAMNAGTIKKGVELKNQLGQMKRELASTKDTLRDPNKVAALRANKLENLEMLYNAVSARGGDVSKLAYQMDREDKKYSDALAAATKGAGKGTLIKIRNKDDGTISFMTVPAGGSITLPSNMERAPTGESPGTKSARMLGLIDQKIKTTGIVTTRPLAAKLSILQNATDQLLLDHPEWSESKVRLEANKHYKTIKNKYRESVAIAKKKIKNRKKLKAEIDKIKAYFEDTHNYIPQRRK